MIRGDVLYVGSDNEVRLSGLRTLDGTVQAAATVTYGIKADDGTVIQTTTPMLADAGTPGDYVADFDAVINDISAYIGVQLTLVMQATASPTLRRYWETPVAVRLSGSVPANPVPGCP